MVMIHATSNIENILTVLTCARQQLLKERFLPEPVLGGLMPALGRACHRHSLEIVRFIAMMYSLTPEKTKHFTITLRILLLFIDPTMAPDVLQFTQSAIKHMISVTDLALVKQEIVAYPERLRLTVLGLYQ